jgi:hypothetical protein
MLNWKYIVLGLAIIVVDLAIYFIFGLLLMSYDDFYDASKGEYWNLGSMTRTEQATYIGLNAWNIINLFAIGYVIYKLINRARYNTGYKI